MTLPDLTPYAWTDSARCAETDPELFFPENRYETATARRICRGCPVRQQCLDTALADSSLTGVWGGTTPEERRILRRDAA